MSDDNRPPANPPASTSTPAVRKSAELGEIPRNHPRANGAPSASINDPEYRAAALANGLEKKSDDTNLVAGHPVDVFSDVDPVTNHRPAVQGDSAITSGDLHANDIVHGDDTTSEASSTS